MDAEKCVELKSLTIRVGALEDVGVKDRLVALEEAHTLVKIELERNTQTTLAIKADTASLVGFAEAAQATTIVGKALGKMLLWLALVAGGLATVFSWWTARK